MNTCQTLYFIAPYRVELREESLPVPKEGQVLLESVCSAISPGSEMLLYRSQFSSLKDCHDSVSSDLSYPTPYGYACVGRIVAVGPQVTQDLLGQLAFAFHAHSTHVLADLDELLFLPAGISPETACFLPNTETAINLVHDAAPLLGERAIVFGQGIVGLLTTALLTEFPLAALLAVDRYSLRREAAQALGVTASLDPAEPDFYEHALTFLDGIGADFSLEISGAAPALNDAIALTRFSGRVIIGSWYGTNNAILDLGGVFHRSRITLYPSQVSTIRPELSGCWNKARRFALAWQVLQRIQPQRWITHRFPFERAAEAYHLLHESPETTIQILFTYE